MKNSFVIESSISEIDKILKNKKIIVCIGTGGVGKTTTSAALAFRAAQIGKNTLVITVDPAKRLASSLGIDINDSEPTEINSSSFAGSLHGLVINPEKVFDGFVEKYSPNREIKGKIFQNKIYQQLKGTLSGSQEFTSLFNLLERVEGQKYDLIILDTPPAQNTRDFLSAPLKLKLLFDSSVVQFFLNSGKGGESENGSKGKSGILAAVKKVVSVGSEKAFNLLGKIVGGNFIVELQSFFSLSQGWHKKISEKMSEIHKVLTDNSTSFVLVTNADNVKLQEAADFSQELQAKGYFLDLYIVNRCYPLWLSNKLPGNSDQGNNQNNIWLKYYKQMSDFYLNRIENVKSFEEEFNGNIKGVLIPELSLDIYNVQGVEQMTKVMAGDNIKTMVNDAKI